MIEYCVYGVVMNKSNSIEQMDIKHLLSVGPCSKHSQCINSFINNVKPDTIINMFF